MLGDVPCSVFFPSCSWPPTSYSQLFLPLAGSVSWRALGLSATSLQSVRSGLALEGRMCQNHSPLFLQAVSLSRWVRPRHHRDVAHRMASDSQRLIALSWFVRENTHLRKSAITESKVRMCMGGWKGDGQSNVNLRVHSMSEPRRKQGGWNSKLILTACKWGKD